MKESRKTRTRDQRLQKDAQGSLMGRTHYLRIGFWLNCGERNEKVLLQTQLYTYSLRSFDH